MRIVAVANQKGGVGKTTTAINLSASLAVLGKRVLLVDLDPQGNVGSGLGVKVQPGEPTIYQALLNGVESQAAVRKTAILGLDIIPSNSQLTGAEIELVGVFSRETRLKAALADLKSEYDFIFLDCPPSIGLLTVNALTAAHALVVPLQCEYYALEGLSHLVETTKLIKHSLNKKLELEGVILTMFDGRNNLSNQVVEETRKYFPAETYKTLIPRNVRVSEAPGYSKPVLLYDFYSRGAQAYLSLAEEFLRRRGMLKGKPRSRVSIRKELVAQQ